MATESQRGPTPSTRVEPAGPDPDPTEVRGALWRLLTLAVEHLRDPSDSATAATLRKAVEIVGAHDEPAEQAAETKLTADAHDAVAAVYRQVKLNAAAVKAGTEPEMTFKDQERAIVYALAVLDLRPSADDLAVLTLESEEITGVKDGPKLAADRTLAMTLPRLLARRRAQLAWARKGHWTSAPDDPDAIASAGSVSASTIRNRRKAARSLTGRAPGPAEKDVVEYGLEILLGPFDAEHRTLQDALAELFRAPDDDDSLV